MHVRTCKVRTSKDVSSDMTLMSELRQKLTSKVLSWSLVSQLGMPCDSAHTYIVIISRLPSCDIKATASLQHSIDVLHFCVPELLIIAYSNTLKTG